MLPGNEGIDQCGMLVQMDSYLLFIGKRRGAKG